MTGTARRTRTAAALRAIGLTSYDALLSTYSADADSMRAFVGHGPLLTDDHPRLEYYRSLPHTTEMVDLSHFTGARREQVTAP